MGKYKLPLEYRMEISGKSYARYGENYYYADVIGEDYKNFYLYVTQHKRNTQSFWMIFDKKTGSGFSFKYGFYDDIVKGMNIFLYYISDDYYIGFIEPEELIEACQRITKTDTTSDQFKFTPQFNFFLSKINENTNQLIVLCRKKNGH